MDEKSEEMSIKSEEVKENNIDFIDIIEKNDKNIIYLKKKDDIVRINPKSIYKILSLILDKTQENLSDIYIDHITINIITPNEKNKFINSIGNIDLEIDNSQLDDKYTNILKDAKKFYINLNSDKNKNIGINKNSLIKIFNFLNKSIIDNSDYINLVILYLKNENKNDLEKLAIEQKIMKKYKSEKIMDFSGIKKHNLNLEIPLQNESHNIYELDNYFNKIIDFMDDYEEDSSFSDKINGLTIPRKTIDENIIKVVNISFIEEGILGDNFDNNDEENNKNEKEKKYSKKGRHSKNPSNITIDNDNICNKNLCNGICNIF